MNKPKDSQSNSAEDILASLMEDLKDVDANSASPHEMDDLGLDLDPELLKSMKKNGTASLGAEDTFVLSDEESSDETVVEDLDDENTDIEELTLSLEDENNLDLMTSVNFKFEPVVSSEPDETEIHAVNAPHQLSDSTQIQTTGEVVAVVAAAVATGASQSGVLSEPLPEEDHHSVHQNEMHTSLHDHQAIDEDPNQFDLNNDLNVNLNEQLGQSSSHHDPHDHDEHNATMAIEMAIEQNQNHKSEKLALDANTKSISMNENTVALNAGTKSISVATHERTVAVPGFSKRTHENHEDKVKVSVGQFRSQSSAGGGYSGWTSVDSNLAQAENLRIAQTKILELEKQNQKLRLQNEELISASEIVRERADLLNLQVNEFRNDRDSLDQSFKDEAQVLKGQLARKDYELSKAVMKVEDLESRMKFDLKKIRIRERELENRLELLRAEKNTLVKSKDEQILDVKRKLDQVQLEVESYRQKCVELNKLLETNQESFKRTTRALRLAMANLEIQEESKPAPLKKVD